VNEAAVDRWFTDKPKAREIFDAVRAQIDAVGPSTCSVQKQISFGVDRKFAWVWLYNVTKANPNGVLHLMLAIDHEVRDPHVRIVAQIGKARWNHQIVVRTVRDARSKWLGKLIRQAYAYGARG
jgi:hypothetical protein